MGRFSQTAINTAGCFCANMRGSSPTSDEGALAWTVKNPLDLRPYPRLNTPNSFFWEKWRNKKSIIGVFPVPPVARFPTTIVGMGAT